MGMCFGNNHQEENKAPLQKAQPPKSKVMEVDVIKSRLKAVRDKIQTAVSRKEQEKQQIGRQIRTRYERSKNKKQLLPLLSTKKEIDTFVTNAETRLQVINRTLRDIEMQQIDANMVNVLDESNKFMAKVQQELDDKDWRSVVEQAKQKYEGVDWGTEEEEDQQFKSLWKQLGGDKLDQKQANVVQQPKKIVQPGVRVVDVPRIQQQEEQRQINYA